MAYREDICLQKLLLLFKCANHSNKRAFVLTANEALVGTLMTISDINDISGESIRLTPMWPRFDSQTCRHMWVALSLLVLFSAPRGFLQVLRFLLSSKTNFGLISVNC